MAQREKLEWHPVNTSALKGEAKKQFAAFIKAHEADRAAWNAFQATVAASAAKKAPAGTEPVMTYKYGRLSLAFREATERSTTSSEDEVTL